jgi:hypothetical protein
MYIRIQLLAFEHHWSISTGSCLTTLLTALILLCGTTTSLPYLKNWLGSQFISNNEELMEGVKTWLSPQMAGFLDTGIQKLIPRYDKCLNSGDHYIEK